MNFLDNRYRMWESLPGSSAVWVAKDDVIEVQIEENGLVYDVLEDDQNSPFPGNRLFFHQGFCHREGKPAQEWKNGDEYFFTWYWKGHVHREDGPAIERHDELPRFFWMNEELTEEEWERRKKLQAFK